MTKTIKQQLNDLGWYFDLFGAGGWVNPDVRDDDGQLIAFDNEGDVIRAYDLQIADGD